MLLASIAIGVVIVALLWDLLRRPWRSTKVAEIEKLRRCRACNTDQQRNRNRQRDQRAALGEDA